MNGVDAIVFTAGIGENAIPVREKVVSYLGYLGVTLDKDANGHRGEEIVISTSDSKVKVAVIPTNEELALYIKESPLLTVSRRGFSSH